MCMGMWWKVCWLEPVVGWVSRPVLRPVAIDWVPDLVLAKRMTFALGQPWIFVHDLPRNVRLKERCLALRDLREGLKYRLNRWLRASDGSGDPSHWLFPVISARIFHSAYPENREILKSALDDGRYRVYDRIGICNTVAAYYC